MVHWVNSPRRQVARCHARYGRLMWTTILTILGTLCGVVVGGVIAGRNQTRAASRQEAAAAERFLLERRQAAYADLVAASTRAELTVLKFLANAELADELKSVVLDGEVALATVKLLAPADTIRSAHRLHQAVLLSRAGSTDSELKVSDAELSAARIEFVNFARRDIGAGVPAAGPAPIHPWQAAQQRQLMEEENGE